MPKPEVSKFYRPSIVKVAQAIAKVDGCTYGACSEEVRQAYDDMAVAALTAMKAPLTPSELNEEYTRGRNDGWEARAHGLLAGAKTELPRLATPEMVAAAKRDQLVGNPLAGLIWTTMYDIATGRTK